MLDLIYKNRSYRRFKQDPISHDDLMDILEAGRVSACGMNKQNISYVLVESKNYVDIIQKDCTWAALLKGAGTPKEDELPVAFIVLCKPEGMAGFSEIDMGLALDAMRLEAISKGIGSCIIGSHNPNKVKEELGLKEDINPRLILALGYPAVSSTIECVKDNSLAYYLDSDKNYHVPKKDMKDILIIK